MRTHVEVEPGYGPQTEFTANTMAAADGNSIAPPYQPIWKL
jgi:hypothetical protein